MDERALAPPSIRLAKTRHTGRQHLWLGADRPARRGGAAAPALTRCGRAHACGAGLTGGALELLTGRRPAPAAQKRRRAERRQERSAEAVDRARAGQTEYAAHLTRVAAGARCCNTRSRHAMRYPGRRAVLSLGRGSRPRRPRRPGRAKTRLFLAFPGNMTRGAAVVTIGRRDGATNENREQTSTRPGSPGGRKHLRETHV